MVTTTVVLLSTHMRNPNPATARANTKRVNEGMSNYTMDPQFNMMSCHQNPMDIVEVPNHFNKYVALESTASEKKEGGLEQSFNNPHWRAFMITSVYKNTPGRGLGFKTAPQDAMLNDRLIFNSESRLCRQ